MPIPNPLWPIKAELPWYDKLRAIVAPTEGVSTALLLIVAAITLVVAFKGGPVLKAAVLVYLVSP